MSHESKHPHANKNNNGSSRVTHTLPNILRQVKENSLSVLINQLEAFFGSCDDLFFELANHAGSNSEQNLYFDSMREVRLAKTTVINAFKDEFNNNFSQLLIPKSADKPDPDTKFENLGLVANEQMEQDVAIASLVAKVRQDCQESLYQLCLRFDYLLTGAQITEANNPLDPKMICEAFSSAISDADLEIKVRIILYKQFDRMVAKHLYKIYNLANELLINAGVLPKISHHPINSNRDHQPSQQTFADSEADKLADNHGQMTNNSPAINPGASFNELSVLLANTRSQMNPAALENRVYTGTSQYGDAISQDLLLNQLNQLQHSANLDGQQSHQQLQTAIYKILQTTGQNGKPSSLSQTDEDVINLVAMFFEFILDDRNLPVPIQALISRLQIPILKIALKDKDFFNNSQHIARLLVNEIASSSIGWSESTQNQQDLLYKLINEIIHSINEEFDGDLVVFEKALKKLKNHSDTEKKRAEVVENRISQAAVGKAKTEHVQKLVQSILLQRLKAIQLPEAIGDFLIDHWQKVLVFVRLKTGENSAEWLQNIQVVDDLVWVFQHHDDEKSKKRIARILPRLIESIRQGITYTSLADDDRDALINNIHALINACADKTFANKPQLTQLNAKQLTSLGEALDGINKSWKEMSALERQQAKQQALIQEYSQKAAQLKPGTWFVYEYESNKHTRFKLASHTRTNDRFTFVNRFGQKTAEKTSQEVAIALQRKTLKPLETGLLVDRAMSKIIANLKREKTPAVETEAS